jgi:Raf kinase inhibitor-like YbhB/YbcL family protein
VLICISVGAAKTGLLTDEKEKIVMPLIITSPSFMHDRVIPARHTCDGLNISPPLTWSGVSAGAKSLALIVDDPDAPDPAAPKMTWVHWVLYNITPNTSGLTEGVAVKDLPAGTLQGVNDWHRTGYGGPCPPVGKHRYFFKLYVLDIVLPDLKHPAKAALEKAMQDHVLAQSELIGLYQRQ